MGASALPWDYHGAMDTTRRAMFFGVLVAVIWGVSFLSIKVTVTSMPPMTLAVARFLVACAVLPAVAFWAKETLRIERSDLPVMAFSGVLGVTLYFYFENNGILFLSASESSLIVATIPVVTVLADRVVLGTRVPPRVYLGSLLSFGGVALIVAQSMGTTVSIKGYAFMTGAVAAWVAYTFATRRVSKRYGRVNVTFWQSLFGLAGCVPFALLERSAWKPLTTTVVLNVLYLGVVCSAAGYWLYVAMIDHLGVGKASIFINLIPVVAVVTAFVFLGDRLGGLQLAGGAIVLFGVYLATAVAPSPERHP